MDINDVVWTESFQVRAGETDPSGRLSVPALCSYLQEAASNHAQALQFSVEQLPGLTWVLVRLHLEVTAYPEWREPVRVETWPAGVQGRYALREYLVYAGSGAIAARATSGWVMIDVGHRRPVPLPEQLASLPLASRPRALRDSFERLPSPAPEAPADELRVRPSDLDMNQHVNNIRYVVWGLDALPAGWLDSRQLASLEVHFRAETTAGAVVGSQVQPDGAQGICLHRIFRLGDGRDAALLRTRWR